MNTGLGITSPERCEPPKNTDQAEAVRVNEKSSSEKKGKKKNTTNEEDEKCGGYQLKVFEKTVIVLGQFNRSGTDVEGFGIKINLICSEVKMGHYLDAKTCKKSGDYKGKGNDQNLLTGSYLWIHNLELVEVGRAKSRQAEKYACLGRQIDKSGN